MNKNTNNIYPTSSYDDEIVGNQLGTQQRLQNDGPAEDDQAAADDEEASCDSAEPKHLFKADFRGAMHLEMAEGMYANKKNLAGLDFVAGPKRRKVKTQGKTKYTKLSHYEYKKLTSSEDEEDFFPNLMDALPVEQDGEHKRAYCQYIQDQYDKRVVRDLPIEGENDPTTGWIPWYCSLPGNDFLVEVSLDFIKDKFNLEGIYEYIDQVYSRNYYFDIMSMIVTTKNPKVGDIGDKLFIELFEKAADVYRMLHVRFLASDAGQKIMLERLESKYYGVCPRYLCRGQAVLPIGLSAKPEMQRVKVYCPQCQDIFPPDLAKQSDLDGANFGGVTYPNFLLKNYPDKYPKLGKVDYVPKIYGFKIFGQAGSKYAYQYDLDGNCINKKEIDKIIEKAVVTYQKKMRRTKPDIKYSQKVAFSIEYGQMLTDQQRYHLPVKTSALEYFDEKMYKL